MVHEHGLGGFKIGVGQIHFRDGAHDLTLRIDIQKTSGQAAQRIVGGVNIKYEKKRVNKITSLKDACSLALLLKQREY